MSGWARGLKKKVVVGEDDDMAKAARVLNRTCEMAPAKGDRL